MPRQRHELWVFLHGELIGRAVRSRRGSVHFSYELNRPVSATALSLSLGPPTRGEAHGGNATYDISAWMDGLLPDNQHTRSRWAQTFGAGSTDPFDLLSTPAGLECAGAVQFCCEATLPRTHDQLVHLSATDIETTLRLLREDAATEPESGTLTGVSDRPRPNGRENRAFRPELRTLRLSLPGAQPKMALTLCDKDWCLPTGSWPTTHIFKPQKAHLNPAVRDSMAVNEHLCQQAAGALGLSAASTMLQRFGDEVCLITERFDRRVEGHTPTRLHFEDLCQALGFAPARKYQTDGGPTPRQIIGLLQHACTHNDDRRFVMAMFYNSLVGNTDAHSKNYGILLSKYQHGFAPLYDLSSAAVYLPTGSVPDLAMIFDVPTNTYRQWSQAAAQLGVNVSIDHLIAMTRVLPDAFDTAVSQCPRWASDTATRVGERIVSYAQATTRRLASRSGSAASAGSTLMSRLIHERCGATVKRTSRPCLLRKGHAGRHRSVL